MPKLRQLIICYCIFCLCMHAFLAQNLTLFNEKQEVKNASIKPINQYVGLQLPQFSQLSHGLSSGPITIIDNMTFFIENLHYDGKGPDAHFWVGKGIEPGRDGILVPNENGSKEQLHAYNGQNVTIKLPDNLTIGQIDYFGMWCIRFAENFGHVVMPWALKQKTEPIQLEPFSSLAHGLRSGPIMVIDERTFFIPNLYYDGKGPDAHFWVGNGSAPLPTGTLVPDENGSTKSISEYKGQSIYIRLPPGLTINQIDYFGVWCIQYKHNFGHVVIPKGLKLHAARPDPEVDIDGKTIAFVPKCCPAYQVLTQNGCAVMSPPFDPRINVHDHNSTHLNDEPIQNIVFEPFVSAIKCPYQKYPLIPNEDKFALLKNGSLMVLNKHEILSQDGYCLETINLSDDAVSNWITTPIVCFRSSDVPLAGTVFIVYASGVLLSAIFLLITALVFLLVKEVRDTRGKCVLGYSLSMAVAFICLASAQLSGIGEQACNTFGGYLGTELINKDDFAGFLIQFFLVSAFTWLSSLSWETYYKIRKYNTDMYTRDRRRLYYYLGIGFGVPLLILLITLIFDRIPAIPNTFFKPQFGKNSCWFDQRQWAMIYFYIPITAAILFNMVLSILMKWNLVWLERHRKEDIAWLAVKHELKPMYRSCGFLLALMTLSWAMEIISFLAQTENGVWIAIDIINSLQGFLVFLIFVLHRPVKDKLHLCALKMRQQRNIEYDKPGEEDIRLHGFNGHNEFLTKLNRSESTEQIS